MSPLAHFGVPSWTRPRFRPYASVPETLLQSTGYISSTRGLDWAWEYLALALSASAVTVLIILLAYIDGLPLTHWNSPVSPTTTVSILAAVARVALGFAISSCLGQAKWTWFRKHPDKLLTFERFDDASRGPWGSFWLILYVRAYHRVAVGAAVMIILLAFEPSFQAIISFGGRNDSSDTALQGLLGRSDLLDTGTYYAYEGVTAQLNVSSDTLITVVPYVSQPDLGLVSSLNSGFYNLSTAKRPTTSFVCPTANCTWSPFTTLAVCSACNDVSSSLKRYRVEGTNLGTLQQHEMQIYTNWTIHSLPRLNLTNMSTAKYNTDEVSIAYISATRLVNQQNTLSFQNLSTMMTAVQMIKVSDGYIRDNITWDDAPVTATECVLHFCANAYESRVAQGELKEETIATWSNRDPASFHVVESAGYSPKELEEWDEWNNNSLYNYYGDAPRSDLQLVIPDVDLHYLNLQENITTVFNLTQRTVGSTLRFINEYFFEETMVWPPEGDAGSGGVPPVVQSTDISETFDRASRSITNWIRDTSNSTQAAPLAAFVIGLGFCAFSVVETRRLGLEAWKTDIIATLTHSVDAETRAQLRHAYRHGHLDKAVNGMVVALEDEGHGLELKIKYM
ncbi:hypothetical protein F5Y08DRAFT_328506 [Xylaria arbuscula]|nr:hypothetical protein F5Y08DRAFT_328506 [Xylaria arbuscula]